MNNYDRDKQLDELLDAMLSVYADAEPRPGLESRVLAGLRAARNEAEARKLPAWRRWKWLWAGAAVAAVVALAALWIGRERPAGPSRAGVQGRPAQAQPAPVRAGVVPREAGPFEIGAERQPRQGVATMSRRLARREGKGLPSRREDAALALDRRPPVFPTPEPLSEQEKLLLRYLAGTAREEIMAQSHPDEPPTSADNEADLAVPDLVLVPQKSSNTR